MLALNLGYQFNIIEAHRYSKGDIFTKFVNHFYDIKRNSTGSKKFLAKLCLNSLYGMFGRQQEVNDVVVVSGKALHGLSMTRIINTFSKIDDDLYLVSISNNINTDLLKELNVTLSSEYVSPQMSVNTNVAIASAVTAYGRILMMQYKVLDCVVYSDTDSLFVTDLKPFAHLIGDELGQFKDELDGLIIDNAIFLGIKQYGFQYTDKSGKVITKSVFAGVKRDSLSYDQLVSLFNGGSIKILHKNRFIRSLSNFNIKIKDMETIVKINSDKELVDNEYLPINVQLADYGCSIKPYLNSINTTYHRLIKQYKDEE